MKCPKCQADNPDTQKFCGECGTNITSAERIPPQFTKTLKVSSDEFTEGTLFAERYQIIQELGRGGMGTVFLVRDTKAKEEIALKLIKPAIAADQKTIDRFRHELITARKIRHKNICGMYDLGEAEGTHYITMEYVPGENLKRVIRRVGSLDTNTATLITKQICAGLKEAHENGVIHRDLKPSNIMIDKMGNARIMDFGIARSLRREGITDSGVIIGTPEYMSPEQIEGKETDQRSDIYSLGIVLYEMLTGSVPFTGDTAISIAYKHKHEFPQDPSTINDQANRVLSDLALKCLEKDKEKRFQSTEEILAAMQGEMSPKPQDDHQDNLPFQPTSFIGREAELDSARSLLTQPGVRLLTLSGPGGIGKTRLGLELAVGAKSEFMDGVYFVPLSPITNPTLVIPTIAQTLGVREFGSQPILETLGTFLRSRNMLLFLDNFEHVGQAAPDIVNLLGICPDIKFLITSREVLHVRGENEFRVQPLASPEMSPKSSLNQITENPAVELFAQRARSVKPDFRITEENALSVGEICARLDGLPLAIELAAARVKLFPPRLLLERLIGSGTHTSLHILSDGPRDAPERHRKLSATMDWSYNLLDTDEQRLLQTLSVFAGGFTLSAAEAVCCLFDPGSNSEPADVLRIDVMQGLSSLLDKSLLQREEWVEEEPRFTILELIREYAEEKLEECGRGEHIRKRHAIFFMGLAEEAKLKLKGPDQETWLERLEKEHNNIRSALGWLHCQSVGEIDQGQSAADLGLRMTGALWQFWDTHGYVSEGRTWLQKFFEKGAALTNERVDALVGAGSLASRQSDMTQALELYEQATSIARGLGHKAGLAEALIGMVYAKEFLGAEDEVIEALYSEGLELWREVGDKRGIATALGPMAHRAANAHDFEKANRLYEESLALFRVVKDKREIAGALWNLGQIAVVIGKYNRAKKMYRESLKIYKDLRDLHGVSTQLRGLGKVEQMLGNTSEARVLYEESLQNFRSMGDKGCASLALVGLGRVTLDLGDTSGAESLTQECLSVSHEIRYKAVEAQALRQLGRCDLAQEDYESAQRHLMESLNLEKELDHREGIIESLEDLARTATALSDFLRAAKLMSAAEAIRNNLGIPLPPVAALEVKKCKTDVQAGLGEGAFRTACAEGGALTVEQAITLAARKESSPSLTD